MASRLPRRIDQHIKRMWRQVKGFTRVNQSSSYGQMAVRDRFADIEAKLGTESPVIIDVGAHTGRIVDLCMSLYSKPIIHAIEPNPDMVAILRHKYAEDENVFIHELALGKESDEVVLNILRRPASSSLLEPSDINVLYHGEEMDLMHRHKVRQERLDKLFDEEIDLLKLDLQGYELEALHGCGQLLVRIKCITVEVEFVPLYEQQPLFAEVDLFLRSQGFRLLNLYDLWTHPDGQLTAGDAVYMNKRFYGELQADMG